MNDARPRRWARAASLASVFLALLLAPLVVAQAANAADPLSVSDLQKLGGAETCVDGTDGIDSGIPVRGCLKFGAYSRYQYSDGSAVTWIGWDDGSTVATNADGANIYVAFLVSVPQPHMELTNFSVQLGDNGQGQGLCFTGNAPENCKAHKYWSAIWDEGAYSGLVCASLSLQRRCGKDAPNRDDGRQLGQAAANDIGYRVTVGKLPSDTLPGQQQDGSVDPIACIQQRLAEATGSTGGAFDPIGYIFTPVQCAFLWATTMPTNTVSDLVNGQTKRWSATQLGSTVNSLDFYSAFSVDNGCRGIVLDLSGLRTPGGPPVADLRLLNACSGDMLAPLAGLVKLGLTLAVLLGGAFAIARMVSQFVKGPTPGPAHASDFDDVLMGR